MFPLIEVGRGQMDIRFPIPSQKCIQQVCLMKVIKKHFYLTHPSMEVEVKMDDTPRLSSTFYENGLL